MKFRLFYLHQMFAACVLATGALSFASAQPTSYPSPSQKPDAPKVSEAEAKAANAIKAAPDAAAKLVAAEAFIQKYPKSQARPQVVEYMLGEIARVGDAAQKLALAEKFQKVFTGDKEVEVIRVVIIDAYVGAKRIDDAFTLGATILAQQPEYVPVLSTLAVAGTEEIKRQNPKYVAQSVQYGAKAIELIEANKKPANLTDAAWTAQKEMLPHLYQQMAVLSLVNTKPSEAKTQLEKAMALNPADPFNYVLMGSIMNDEYQKVAEKYKAMPESKEKAEMLIKANEMIDKVIDLYAHSVALSEGRPEYQKLREQVLQDLTPFYQYRHNGSTEGMQQLIDKYKAPAKP